MTKFIKMTIADTGRTFYTKRKLVEGWSGTDKGVTKVTSSSGDQLVIMENVNDFAKLMGVE